MLPSRSALTMTRRRGLALAACSWLVLASGGALAQDTSFPSKPIRILIPTAPGGNLDVMTRLVAEKLQAAWGQPVIVESKPGANTMLATSTLIKSPADGYTALSTISGLVQNLVLRSDAPYKLSDVTPVSMVASFPIVLAANAKLPASTMAEVVKLAKDKPGTLSFGSYGVGSGGHVIGEGLNKLAGIDIRHVPYKGEAAELPDLISGQIQLGYGSVGFFARQVPNIKLIAVASPQRLKDFPDVPTFAEAGFADVNLPGWGGMFLPAGTPKPIVDKWVSEVRRIVAMPDVQKRILEMGFVPVGNNSAEFAKDMTVDLEKWGTVVRANNIKLE